MSDLFAVVRESLEALAHEASYADASDGGQGTDAVYEIEREARVALGRIQAAMEEAGSQLSLGPDGDEARRIIAAVTG